MFIHLLVSLVTLFLISSFVALISFPIPTSFIQPAALPPPGPSSLSLLHVCSDGYQDSDTLGLFLDSEELRAATFLTQEASNPIFQFAARALTVT